MKANEAPEKIYLIRNIPTPTALNTTKDCHDKYLHEWYKGREKDTDVEYTRTDAFIKKACDWFRWIDCDDRMPPFETTEEFIEEFKKYMKGE